jgi:nucleoside-diphosphate-sugar epimerase
MATFLVTGAAGFIGSKVAEQLLERGDRVVGVDNLNDAYDVRLKEWRLARLLPRPGFEFAKQDIAERTACHGLFQRDVAYDGVINLAARAGVRQSVENPWVYNQANSDGTLNLLEESTSSCWHPRPACTAAITRSHTARRSRPSARSRLMPPPRKRRR